MRLQNVLISVSTRCCFLPLLVVLSATPAIGSEQMEDPLLVLGSFTIVQAGEELKLAQVKPQERKGLKPSEMQLKEQREVGRDQKQVEPKSSVKIDPKSDKPAQKLDAKTQEFLRAVMAAGSLEDLAQTFKGRRFSDSEQKALQKELEKEPYAGKVRKLTDEAKSKMKSRQSEKEAKVKHELEQKTQEFVRAQQQEVARLNAATQGHLSQLQRVGQEAIPIRPIPESPQPQPGFVDYGTPEITAIRCGGSGACVEISPGQTVIIEGRNFGPRPGGVRFQFADKTLWARFDVWEPTYISAYLADDIGGLKRTEGRLIVQNPSGRETARAGITFKPILVIADIGGYCDCIAWPLFGCKEQHTVCDTELINDWRVKDSSLEHVEACAGGSGVDWVTRPTKGSTHARARLKVWCDLGGCSGGRAWIQIEGPRGMPYK